MRQDGKDTYYDFSAQNLMPLSRLVRGYGTVRVVEERHVCFGR